MTIEWSRGMRNFSVIFAIAFMGAACDSYDEGLRKTVEAVRKTGTAFAPTEHAFETLVEPYGGYPQMQETLNAAAAQAVATQQAVLKEARMQATAVELTNVYVAPTMFKLQTQAAHLAATQTPTP